MDKVKVVGRPGPGGRGVVDFEAHVGRDPGWLDGGEVRAGYFGRGEFIGEVAMDVGRR